VTGIGYYMCKYEKCPMLNKCQKLQLHGFKLNLKTEEIACELER
jgi:hypothetical protein